MPDPVPPADERRNLARDRRRENLRDRRPQASHFDEPVHIENALGEFSDRNQRSIDGDRPDRDVDARAVAQPRIDHGRGFIDAPSDRRDDPVDDAQEVRFILEMDLGLLQLPEALDVAALVRVDENVGDRRVLQQRLERTIAGHLGDDLVRESVELFLIERQAFAANVVADISSNLLCKFVRQLLQRRQIEFVDDALVQLQLFVEQPRPARDQIGVDVVRARRWRFRTRLRDRRFALDCALAAEESHGLYPIDRRGAEFRPHAKRRYRGDILDRLVRRIGERDRRSDVHALDRDGGVSDAEALLLAENPRHMIGARHLAQEAEVASVDHRSHFRSDRGFLAQRSKRLLDLPQARNGVEAGDQNPLRRREQGKRPGMNGERQIDDDRGISLRHPIEQCGQSLDAEIAGVKPAAACRQHVQSARMMADEGAQQMVVETVRSGDNLLELKFWRDVEIVAHVARLEIKIDKRDLGAFGRLGSHQLDGGFDREGGIAHASRARRERNHGRQFARGHRLWPAR